MKPEFHRNTYVRNRSTQRRQKLGNREDVKKRRYVHKEGSEHSREESELTQQVEETEPRMYKRQ